MEQLIISTFDAKDIETESNDESDEVFMDKTMPDLEDKGVWSNQTDPAGNLNNIVELHKFAARTHKCSVTFLKQQTTNVAFRIKFLQVINSNKI
jgi:hypothetical protein